MVIVLKHALELAAAWKTEKVPPVLQKFLQVVREIATD